jgi:hypothetical protein
VQDSTRFPRGFSWSIVLALLAIAACAGESAKVSSSFEGSARPTEPYHKVIVVAVSPDVNVRCPFERFLAARLAGEVTEAVASCEVTDKKAPLTRELIEKAVADQGANAVLTTHLVSQDWSSNAGGGRDTRGSHGYKATDSGWSSGGYYGAYGVPVVYGDFQHNAASLVITGTVHLTSKLYDARNGSVVYTMETTAKGVESHDSGVSLLTTSMGEKMAKDGLVK